jgi:hypothetical protein
MRRAFIALFSLAIGAGAMLSPASAGDISVAEAGARYGQAKAAAKFCPGGTVSAKAETLAKSFVGENTAVFKAEEVKVTEAWDKAFACIEVDPNTNRTTQCRKMRLTSCRQAWIEIGAEGRNVPGLLDVDFGAWEEKHPPAP